MKEGSILHKVLNIGASQEDDEALRLKKSSMVIVPLIIAPSAVIWGSLYLFLDLKLSASIPLSYAFISFVNLWHLYRTKNIIPLYHIQMLLVLLLPFLLMWSLGGFALGSFVFIWAFFAPIAALIYENRQKGMYWFYAFLGLVVISSLIDQTLIESTQYAIPQIAIELFFFLNVSAGLAGVFFLIRYFINEKEENANVRLEREHNALLEKSKELEEANAQLSYYANHDALTKLPNRYFLYKVLDEKIKIAMHNNRTMAVIFIDLDGFKEVNNSYGHSVGDKLLSTVASRLNALVNENDLIARVGGDEFVLIMSNIDKLTEVTQKAEDIIQTVNDDYPFLSSDMQVGVSIGISLFPKHSNDIDELIDFADKAMYTVKEGVKNSYLFYEENMNSDQIKD